MPKIFSTIVLILSINFCYSQNTLQFGKVKNDRFFNCKHYLDNNFEKNSICNSKNELEIRLYSIGFPRGNHNLIILSFSKKWRAVRYEMDVSLSNEPVTKTILDDDSLNNCKLEHSNIFDSLKANNIFLLPNQYDLKIERSVLDGVGYFLEFKAKNKFNSYRFSNPESYAKSHPEIKEFRQYANIAKLMFGLFKE